MNVLSIDVEQLCVGDSNSFCFNTLERYISYVAFAAAFDVSFAIAQCVELLLVLIVLLLLCFAFAFALACTFTHQYTTMHIDTCQHGFVHIGIHHWTSVLHTNPCLIHVSGSFWFPCCSPLSVLQTMSVADSDGSTTNHVGCTLS